MDEYAAPPKNKDELMSWIEREWNLLQEAIKSLDEAQISAPGEGGWSIKDNLAHLAEWERFLRLNHLRRIAPHDVIGIDQDGFAALDEEGVNIILFQRNKNRPVAEVKAMLQQSHTLVLAELAKWSFADLMKPRFEDGDPGLTVLLYVAGNTYEHYREHRETIEEYLKGA